MIPGPTYRELPPPPHLAADVACLWVVEAGRGHPAYRVLPDGCVDLVVQPAADGAPRLDVVGTMRGPQDVALAPGARLMGLRFRPGMAYRYLPMPADELADSTVPLAAVSTSWGRELAMLAARLTGEAPAAPGAVAGSLASFAARLRPLQPAGPVQHLCRWLTAAHGSVRIDDLASQANLSGRQMRRLFLTQVGLGPKQLARILRFQRVLALAGGARRPDWAGLACDCGYADQAHLVHEFSALAGCSPGQLAAGLGR